MLYQKINRTRENKVTTMCKNNDVNIINKQEDVLEWQAENERKKAQCKYESQKNKSS